MERRRTIAYRYPTEQPILCITLLAVGLVILLTAALTFRISLIVVAIAVTTAYITNRFRHIHLLGNALLVNKESAPALTSLARECIGKLQSGPIQLFIARDAGLNAYTFGLLDPKVVVIYSSVFHEMDAEEIRFILGHELGHICLGHTWLNSIVGGIAGVPANMALSSLLKGVFLWWNRACEYSADRAGLLACGNPQKAISALAKLSVGPGKIRNTVDLHSALLRIENGEDQPYGALAEVVATHPNILRRIRAVQRYAASHGYQVLQEQMKQNLTDRHSASSF